MNTVSTPSLNAKQNDTRSLTLSSNPVTQRIIEQTTAGIENHIRNVIADMSEENKEIVAGFLQELTYKENAASKTKITYILTLHYLLKDIGKKSFRDASASDIELYLQGHQKPKYLDPKQKWITTHNLRAVVFIKFFKWLYHPEIESKKRPKPDVVSKVVTYAKQQQSNIEGKDLWLPEEDRVFLKYCPDARLS